MRVTISGGVHGNELTGIYAVKTLQNSMPLVKNIELDFLLANPKAIKENRRYIDQDLNRSFAQEALQNDSHIYEYERAKVIRQRLQKSDFLIDIHSTTANMGVTLVLSDIDEKSTNLAKILSQEYEDVRILRWLSNEEGDFINSVVPSSMTIEVGPVCQGVLDAAVFERTMKVLRRAIEILDRDEHIQKKLEAFEVNGYKDFPRNKDELAGMIHPEFAGHDYEPLYKGDPIFVTFDGDEKFYDGDTCYPVFINEAAYYEKGIAFCITQKIVI